MTLSGVSPLGALGQLAGETLRASGDNGGEAVIPSSLATNIVANTFSEGYWMHDRTDARTPKFGHLLIGAMLSLSSLACGEQTPEEGATQTVVSALTSTSYEAETLARTASAAGSKVTTETGASAGQYVQFNSSTPAVGDWIEFTLPNVAAGTYDVAMLYKSNTNRAIVQASIDGVNQGASCDQYAATPAFQVRCGLGTATLSSGNHVIRFTAVGKRSSSTSYLEIVDQISLTVSGGGTGTGGSGTGGSGTGGSATGGTSTGGSGGAGGGTSAAYEAEALARTASAAGSKVTSESGASGGAYVQFTTTTPAVGDWIEFTLPNVAAGTYDVAMLYKSNANRGIVQASIDGVNQGPSCNQYAASSAFQVRCSLGAATLSSGNHLIRFTVTGKTSSSTSYFAVIDQISLTVTGTVPYAPCPTDGSVCKILPFGDSITEGAKSTDTAGYRSQLFKLVVAANQKITFVGSQTRGPATVSGQTFPAHHEGHAGWTIDPGYNSYSGISTLVPSPALSYGPHIILLHIGTNDLFAAGTSSMATRLDALVEKIAQDAPSALIVLAQITPPGTSNSSTTAAQMAYNSKIPGIIQAHAARGQHIMGVDMSKMPLSDLTSGGVHPNDAGYSYMANIWYAAIKNLLPR